MNNGIPVLQYRVKNLFYEGKYYRSRDIETVSSLFLQTKAVRAKLQTRINLWQEKVFKSKLNAFWGWSPCILRTPLHSTAATTLGRWTPEIKTFTVEKNTDYYRKRDRQVSIANHDSDDLEEVLALEPNPAKFMADPRFDDEEAHALLERRLKGDIKLIPQNQELCDEYTRLDIRRGHASKVSYLCEQFLLRYISQKFRDLYSPFSMETVLHLTIKDHTYTVLFNRSKFMFVDDVINQTCDGKDVIE